MAASRIRKGPEYHFLQGYCPSCERSTALVIMLNQGKMPASGAARIEPMCISCGATWELPKPGTKMSGRRKQDGD